MAHRVLLAVAAVLFTVQAVSADTAKTVSLVGGVPCSFDMKDGPKRSDFPEGFIFGSATSAYQVEGAHDADGKGASIWDTYASNPANIWGDGSNANVACDSYNKFSDDVKIMKDMGMESYRFSISWPRVLPEGTGDPNPMGIKYYNDLIDALHSAGIKPAVTLYHWDLPQALEDKYGGWLNAKVIDDFTAYADLCFATFGDRVDIWITFNEVQQITVQGYRTGSFAPGRCSDRTKCVAGDGDTEPYIVARHILLSHAEAVKLYRAKYQKQQKGKIGITLDSTFLFPASESAEDKAAAELGLELQFGWLASPVVHGVYPQAVVGAVGERLPPLTAADSAVLKGSVDFLGLNLYTGAWASPGREGDGPYMDGKVHTFKADANNRTIGPSTGSDWLKMVPKAIFGQLVWMRTKYPGVPIYITENGVSQKGDTPKNALLCDTQRVEYFQQYLANVLMAIRQQQVPVMGYYAWSLLDNAEWGAGFSQRFGIYYIDFEDPERARVPKASASFWTFFNNGK